MDNNDFQHPAKRTDLLTGRLNPKYVDIDPQQRNQPPYCYIGQILVGSVAAGTGWLVSSSVVVTAAHVIGYSNTCNLRFPGQGDLQAASIRRIKQPYVSNQKGSQYDVACILLSERLNGAGNDYLPLAMPPLTATARVIGTLNDNGLQWSEGAAQTVGSFVGFEGDSPDAGGFSGAPLLLEGKAIAVYLGNASDSFTRATDAERLMLGTARNCGLALTRSVVEFIQLAIQEAEQ